MIEAPHYTSAGSKRDGAFALPAEYFDGTVNEPVLHQAVKVFLNNQRQGTAADQDPELRLRRQPEAVEAEGHRPRAAGLHPRAALAGWRHGLRTAAARLPHRDPAQGEAAGAALGAQRAGARGRAARDRAVRVPAPEDGAARRTCSTAWASTGARSLVLTAGTTTERVPERPEPADRRGHAVRPRRRPTTSSGRTRWWWKRARSPA